MGVEQYRALFVAESEEHLQIMNNAVLSLEKDSGSAEILNEIFRSAHTLKGMAATMGFEALAKLTHKMEDVLDIFRTQKMSVSTEVIDALFKCLDMLALLLEEIKSEKEMNLNVDAIILQLESVIPAISSNTNSITQEEKRDICLNDLERKNLVNTVKEHDFKIYTIDVQLSPECRLKSVRVFMVINKLNSLGEVVKSAPSTETLEQNQFGSAFSLLFLTKSTKRKLDEALENILEVDAAKIKEIKDINELLAEEKSAAESVPIATVAKGKKETLVKDLTQHFSFKKIQSIRVSTDRLDKLMNLVGELVIAKIRIIQIALSQQIQPLTEILANIDRLTGQLQDEVMQARLIPMAQVFDRFPRMVRDLARSQQKQINFEITGGEIEMDRTVLDEIADPLVHLLRNSVDHGIELPQERKRANKSPVGTVKLIAQRERTCVLVKISDDGRGINLKMLREIAIRKGFLTEEEVNKLNDREMLNIITLPGFSSAKEVTDTSGRGVGMDVAKMKIEALGGSLSFNSELGKGSEFNLKLPLTVAIIRAMLVSVGSETYAAPIANIVETVKVAPEKIKYIEKFEVINLRGEVLPLVRLGKILNTSVKKEAVDDRRRWQEEDGNVSIVVVESTGKKAGLVVDGVLGQQEVVIKSVGALLKGIKGFAGATILGDGRVALILDVATLVGYEEYRK
ncbi:MAG: chemotaxis protein CheA [Candidatus Omnitrophica bacterium]|nr:chemotaxis protein CheA [Candidatus Omnitrophota bacterium]